MVGSMPPGMLPERIRISPARTRQSSCSSSSSCSSGEMNGPGSLMSVFCFRSGSKIFRFVRVWPEIRTASEAMPHSSKNRMPRSPASPPQNAAAVLLHPKPAKHFDTLMPLPPTSVRTFRIRLTALGEKDGITTVLSMAGFKVSVYIIGLPPAAFISIVPF